MPDPKREGKLLPLCVDHTIADVLRRHQEEVEQQAKEMEIMRQEIRDEAKRGYHGVAWQTISQYVILINSDEDLMVSCATNPLLRYKVNNSEMQGGHYFRANKFPAIMYDIRNILPQSRQENKHFAGNQEAMALAIEAKYGEGTIAKLELLKNGPELTDDELVAIKKKYRALINEELLRRGISNPWGAKRKKKY